MAQAMLSIWAASSAVGAALLVLVVTVQAGVRRLRRPRVGARQRVR